MKPHVAVALAIAGVLAGAGRVAASPAALPLVDTRGEGARVDMVGGIVHHFKNRWLYVATAEATFEHALTPRLSVLGTLPLAMVERDGEMVAGWGNLGAGLRYRARTECDGGAWTRTLTWQVSAPTAPGAGDTGLAAQSAADLHAALDLGDYLAGAITTRATAALRWQGERWWFGGALNHRLHVFTFMRGDTEYWQPVTATLGLGYRRAGWSLGATMATKTDLIEERWGGGDHFRHVVRVGVERAFARWQAELGLLLPVDIEARIEQSPMISLGVTRRLGG